MNYPNRFILFMILRKNYGNYWVTFLEYISKINEINIKYFEKYLKE